MRISNILERFAKSKTGQKVYKWACKPKSEEFLNSSLPQIETGLSTLCYIVSTERQKNLDRDEKNVLQIQNVGSGAIGIAIGSAANRKVGKFGEEVIKHLDTKKVDPKSIRQISTGIRIILPIVSTALLMRLVLPTITAGLSGKIMDRVREKRKLDTQA